MQTRESRLSHTSLLEKKIVPLQRHLVQPEKKKSETHLGN